MGRLFSITIRSPQKVQLRVQVQKEQMGAHSEAFGKKTRNHNTKTSSV